MAKFKPGESGNYLGRPKKRECIPDILREITSRPDQDKDNDILYSILEGVVETALSGHKWSIEFIADRLEGKPRQTVIQEKKEPFSIDVVDDDDDVDDDDILIE